MQYMRLYYIKFILIIGVSLLYQPAYCQLTQLSERKAQSVFNIYQSADATQLTYWWNHSDTINTSLLLAEQLALFGKLHFTMDYEYIGPNSFYSPQIDFNKPFSKDTLADLTLLLEKQGKTYNQEKIDGVRIHSNSQIHREFADSICGEYIEYVMSDIRNLNADSVFKFEKRKSSQVILSEQLIQSDSIQQLESTKSKFKSIELGTAPFSKKKDIQISFKYVLMTSSQNREITLCFKFINGNYHLACFGS